MKKKYLLILMIGLFALLFTISVGAVYNYDNNMIYKLRQMIMHQNKESDSDGNVYARGKNISITKKEMKDYTNRFMLSDCNEDEAQNRAFQFLVRSKTLLFAAKSEGYEVDDSELDQIIEDRKKEMNDPAYKDTMKPMYAAFGGEEKYWEYIREDIRNSAIIEKFFVDKEKEYSSLEEDKSWEEEQQQLIEELIREQNVKIVK